jgi:hypothetical protein
VCGVLLDPRQQIKRGTWTGCVALGLQPHAHDAVEDESEEADQGMGADAVRQTVMNRRDLNIGFQHAEAALNVGKAFVAGDGLCRGEIGRVGQEGQFAVEELRCGNGLFIECPGEAVSGNPKFDSKTDKRLISFRPNGQKCYNASAVRRVLAG